MEERVLQQLEVQLNLALLTLMGLAEAHPWHIFLELFAFVHHQGGIANPPTDGP